MINNEDYRLVLVEKQKENSLANFEILKGKFKGVIFETSDLQIEEDEQNDQAYLRFNYDVIFDNDHENLTENIEFKTIVGDVLMSVVMDAVENSNENRTDDSETSDL